MYLSPSPGESLLAQGEGDRYTGMGRKPPSEKGEAFRACPPGQREEKACPLSGREIGTQVWGESPQGKKAKPIEHKPIIKGDSNHEYGTIMD